MKRVSVGQAEGERDRASGCISFLADYPREGSSLSSQSVSWVAWAVHRQCNFSCTRLLWKYLCELFAKFAVLQVVSLCPSLRRVACEAFFVRCTSFKCSYFYFRSIAAKVFLHTVLPDLPLELKPKQSRRRAGRVPWLSWRQLLSFGKSTTCRIHSGKHLMWHPMEGHQLSLLAEFPSNNIYMPESTRRIHIVGLLMVAFYLPTHSFPYHPTLALLQICLAYRLCDRKDYLPAPGAWFERPSLGTLQSKQLPCANVQLVLSQSQSTQTKERTDRQMKGKTDGQTDKADWVDTLNGCIPRTFATVYFGLFCYFCYFSVFFLVPLNGLKQTQLSCKHVPSGLKRHRNFNFGCFPPSASAHQILNSIWLIKSANLRLT